jgi:hypothetical protein
MTLRSCDLLPASLYASWPKPLIQILCRSYQAHSTSIRTLPAAFTWDSEIEPKNFDDALGLGRADLVKTVYDRMVLHSPLWAFIDLIYQAFPMSGSFGGFDFSLESAGRKFDLISFLNSSSRFCRDTSVGQSFHQANPTLAEKLVAPSRTCWREVVRDSPGLHICVDNIGYSNCTIHIDLHQCVLAKDSDGFCIYDPVATAKHLLDIRTIVKKI